MKISEQIRASSEVVADADLVMKQVERWERTFEASVDKVLNGIGDYQTIMKKIAGLPHSSAKEIGNRGVNTAKSMYDRWISIKDDLFALKSALRADMEDEED